MHVSQSLYSGLFPQAPAMRLRADPASDVLRHGSGGFSKASPQADATELSRGAPSLGRFSWSCAVDFPPPAGVSARTNRHRPGHLLWQNLASQHMAVVRGPFNKSLER